MIVLTMVRIIVLVIVIVVVTTTVVSVRIGRIIVIVTLATVLPIKHRHPKGGGTSRLQLQVGICFKFPQKDHPLLTTSGFRGWVFGFRALVLGVRGWFFRVQGEGFIVIVAFSRISRPYVASRPIRITMSS